MQTEFKQWPNDHVNSRGSLEAAMAVYNNHTIVKAVMARRNNQFKREVENKLKILRGQLKDVGTPEGWAYKGMTNLDRLEKYFRSFCSGNAIDLQSQIFWIKGPDKVYTDRQSVMNEWWSFLETKISGDLLKEVESEHVMKVGSRSMRLPFDMIEDKIRAINTSLPSPDVPDTILAEAEAWLVSLIPKHSLVPYKLQDVLRGSLYIDAMKGETASGYPYFSSGWKPGQDIEGSEDENAKLINTVFRDILHEVSELEQQLASQVEIVNWNIPYTRGHYVNPELEDQSKQTRGVMAGRKALAIKWKTITSPIMDILPYVEVNGVRHFIGMKGPLHTDVEMYHAMNKQIDGEWVSQDFSSFDLTKNQDWSMRIVHIMSSWFRHENVRNQIVKMGEIEYLRTGLITPSGIIEPSEVTQSSGSGITLLHNSLYAIFALKVGELLDAYHVKASLGLGDDLASKLVGATPDGLSQVFAQMGLTVKPEAQKFGGHEVHFLQKIHNQDTQGGIYPTTRALLSIISPERNLKSTGLPRNYCETIRLLGPLHNVEFHPQLVEFIEMIRSYDRNRLFMDLSLSELLAGAGEEAQQVVDDFTKSHISSEANPTSIHNWVAEKVRRRMLTEPVTFASVYGQPLDQIKRDVRGVVA